MRLLFAVMITLSLALPPFAQERAELKRKGENEVFEQGKDGVSRVTILYKERAKYTSAARKNRVHGTVQLRVAFHADEHIEVLEVIRGLPDGLTDSAIDAAKRVRFRPAEKDGKPVRTEGQLEFTFDLY